MRRPRNCSRRLWFHVPDGRDAPADGESADGLACSISTRPCPSGEKLLTVTDSGLAPEMTETADPGGDPLPIPEETMRRMLDALAKRRWHAAAATAAAVAALAVAGSTPAMAAPATPAGTATSVLSLQDFQTGRCLDSNAAGHVYTNPCQTPGNPYQDWTDNGYTINGKFYLSFRDVATGRCLDSNAAGNLYTNPCQAPGNPYQDWVHGYPGRPAAFFGRQTQRCLDSNAVGNAYTLQCNGGNFQNWLVNVWLQ